MKSIHEPISLLQDDLLERHIDAKNILYRLTDDDCPSVIGIYGGWGSGKSSLLNLIIEISKEEKNPELHFEVFDAWKYETLGNLLIPIFVNLGKQANQGSIKPLNRLIKVSSLFFSDIALRKTTGVSVKEVNEYLELTSQSNNYETWKRAIDDIESSTKDFEALIKQVTKKQKAEKVIVCIDNLDRCSPENCIKLIESIKNLFNIPNCIWVLAIDHNVIANYINQKYEKSNINGYAYLEKIIVEHYSISSIGKYHTEELLAHIDAYFETDLDFDAIGYLLTLRKIIRVGIKFKDLLETKRFNLTNTGKHYLFGLLLLYNIWPEFYEYLSTGSATPERTRGIFANFYDNQYGEEDQAIAIPEKFQDSNLQFFIQSVFIKKINSPGISIGDSKIVAGSVAIANLMNDLKDFDLP